MPFKFSENETVTNLEDVDEELRVFYAPSSTEDGTYAIREELRAAASSWDNVQTANQSIRTENKTLRKGRVDLSPLSEYGEAPEEIATTIKGRIQELSDALDKKKDLVNPEKIRTEMKRAHQEEMNKVLAQTNAYKDQLYTHLVKNKAHEAISEFKGDQELLMGFVTKQVKIIDEDGKLVPRVVDEEGEPRIGGAGSFMTVKELVKSMKGEKKYAKLFEAEVKPGSGANPNRVSGAGGASNGANVRPAQKIQNALERKGL